MKFEKFRDGMFGPTLILLAICALTTFALAGVYQATEEKIAEAEARAADEARSLVLSSSDSFTKLEGVTLPDGVLEAYVADNGTGYVFTSQAKGYDGMVTFIVGINNDGEVVGINMFDHSETPGLGAEVGNTEYLETFYRRPDPNEVEGYSGATMTTNALRNSISQSIHAFTEITGADVEVPELAAEEEMAPSISLEGYTEITGVEFPTGVLGAWRAADGSDYVVKAQAKGYKDQVAFLVKFDLDGKFLAISMEENQETEGAGTTVGTAAYLSQYYGLDDPDAVEAKSGATATSDALKKALRRAQDAFALIQEVA